METTNKKKINLFNIIVMGIAVLFTGGSIVFYLDSVQEVGEMHASGDLGTLVEEQREKRVEKQELFEKIKLIDEELKIINEEVTKQQYEGLHYMNKEYLQGFE